MKKSISSLFVLLLVLGCFSAQLVYADQNTTTPGTIKPDIQKLKQDRAQMKADRQKLMQDRKAKRDALRKEMKAKRDKRLQEMKDRKAKKQQQQQAAPTTK